MHSFFLRQICLLAFFLMGSPALLDRLSILTRAYGGTNHMRHNRYLYLKQAGNVYSGSFDCVLSTIKGSFQIECIDNNCRVDTLLLSALCCRFFSGCPKCPPTCSAIAARSLFSFIQNFEPLLQFRIFKNIDVCQDISLSEANYKGDQKRLLTKCCWSQKKSNQN